jgi:hypothetical protein
MPDERYGPGLQPHPAPCRGPNEVHKMVLARRELNRWAKRAEAEVDAGPLEPRHPARMV